jgi:hypothetical protein
VFFVQLKNHYTEIVFKKGMNFDARFFLASEVNLNPSNGDPVTIYGSDKRIKPGF